MTRDVNGYRQNLHLRGRCPPTPPGCRPGQRTGSQPGGRRAGAEPREPWSSGAELPSPHLWRQRSETDITQHCFSFEATVMAMMERMSQRLNSLSTKVEQSGRAPNHLRTGGTETGAAIRADSYRPTHGWDWADIPVDERPDLTTPLTWEDDAAEESTQLRQVSDSTTKVLKNAFQPMSNQARLQARRPYLFPDVESTRCPKLDPVAKQLLQQDHKQEDAYMAKLQMLLLDAMRGTLTTDQAAEATKSAISLLVNASTHMSRERRKKVISCLNKVHPLPRMRTSLRPSRLKWKIILRAWNTWGDLPVWRRRAEIFRGATPSCLEVVAATPTEAEEGTARTAARGVFSYCISPKRKRGLPQEYTVEAKRLFVPVYP